MRQIQKCTGGRSGIRSNEKFRSFAVTCALLATGLYFLQVASALAEPERKALLIGINEYVSPKVTNLRGAVNDVTMLRRILITRFGFDERDIIVLTDAQATRNEILSAIDELVASTDADDSVYFHYSGHGSRFKDRNGDEEDGYDETILPHNARMPGVADIIDDEFERRFAKIKAKNVLIVFDSCYAGTITRSASVVQPRATMPDTREELYKDIATRAVVEVGSLPHVLMTGAPADEQALDGPVDEGFYGLFSYSLARSLDINGPDATPKDVLKVVNRELQRIREQLYTSPPEPQLEGPEERLRSAILPIATASQNATDHVPRRTWLSVRELDNARLLLVDGIELNARPGSQWGIYAADEKQFKYGNALALGRVDSLRGDDAVLTVQLRRSAIPAGARAIAVAPPDPGVEVPVRLGGVNDARRLRLAAAIQAQAANVRFVDEGEFARFQTRLKSGRWQVFDAGGLQPILTVTDGADDTVAASLAVVFTRSTRAITLLALDNPASSLDLTLKVSGTGSNHRIRAGGDARTFKTSLMLELQTDRDAYITVVDVDAEGGINLLFPNDYQDPSFLPDGLISANVLVQIPDSLSDNNRAGFHWDLSPPVGRDTIRVFAATSLATAETIRDFIRDAREPGAGLNGLRTDLTTRAVRGVRVVADSAVDDWSAASVTIDVRE